MFSVFSTISGSMWLDKNRIGISRSLRIISAASMPSIPLPRSISIIIRSILGFVLNNSTASSPE